MKQANHEDDFLAILTGIMLLYHSREFDWKSSIWLNISKQRANTARCFKDAIEKHAVAT
jgi:hypothetical protein